LSGFLDEADAVTGGDARNAFGMSDSPNIRGQSSLLWKYLPNGDEGSVRLLPHATRTRGVDGRDVQRKANPCGPSDERPRRRCQLRAFSEIPFPRAQSQDVFTTNGMLRDVTGALHILDLTGAVSPPMFGSNRWAASLAEPAFTFSRKLLE
jgi:hypothetical protein